MKSNRQMYKFIQSLFDKLWKENIVAQFILDPYDLDFFFFKCPTNLCKKLAIYLIFSLPLHHTSRSFQSIDTLLEDERDLLFEPSPYIW